jgi:hypothetical protein
MITWATLVRLEPALDDLLARARTVNDGGGRFFCPVDEFIHEGPNRPSLQTCLNRLVGWHARRRHPLLTTSEAWNLALRTILDNLPPCRGCGCILPDGSFA